MSKTYVVQEGDTIFSIAAANQFRTWETIYNHPQNDSLRNQRPDAGQLVVGDQLFIPDKQPKTVECETGKTYTFVVKTLKAYVSLYLEDEDENPYANKHYRLKVDDKQFDGVTAPDGMLRQEVPLTTKQAELTLWPTDGDTTTTVVWILDIGAAKAEV